MKHLKTYAALLSMLLILTAMSITSCSLLKDPEIDKLKEDVSQLQNSVSALQEAYSNGKVITGVEILTTGVGGWNITFSDNTTITLQNGENGATGEEGVTPYVKIDSNNNWIVSYDNGQTYRAITDDEGNPITAKGIDGEDGVSLDVRVNSDGNFEIITYKGDKSQVLSVFPTPYSANPDNQIASIVEDSERGVVTITMSSGKQYNFGQALNYPTSIVIINEEIFVEDKEGTAEIEFYVNPSNAKITKDDIVINQVTIKEQLKSYANPTPNYEIISLESIPNSSGEQSPGHYKLTIKHKGENGVYQEICTLVISSKDAQNNNIEITSEKFYIETYIFEETGPYNGHEYVDLGLPSGIKWATCNVGATSPEEYGDYFAWGETEPKDDYTWNDYKYCNGDAYSFTKYCTNSEYGTVDNKTTLDLEDDAARINWGGNWRMPTRAEQDELRNTDLCTWEWTTQNGVNGYKVTSKINGNSIFLPAAGFRNYGNFSGAGSVGYYWLSSHDTNNDYCAFVMFLFTEYFGLANSSRSMGLSVRAVCP